MQTIRVRGSGAYRARARDARSHGMRENHLNSLTTIEAAQQRINNIITGFLGGVL